MAINNNNDLNENETEPSIVYTSSGSSSPMTTTSTTTMTTTTTTQLIELLRSHDWESVRQHLQSHDGERDARTRIFEDDHHNYSFDTSNELTVTALGYFPLCDASCAKEAPNDIVIQMIQLFPDALVLPYLDKAEPTTTTTTTPTTTASTNKMLSSSSSSSSSSSLQSSSSSSSSSPLIAMAASRTTSSGATGFSQLFKMKGYNIPLNMIKVIVDIKPACLTQVELLHVEFISKSLFLHRVCALSENVALMEYVLSCYPIAISIQDSIQRLPLHYLCSRENVNNNKSNNTLSNVIRHFVDQYPLGAQTIDFCGNTPLHYACQERNNKLISLRTIQHLMTTYPLAVTMTNSKGQTPLHMVCRNVEPNLNVLLHLIGQNPKCLLMRDKNYMIPFDVIKDRYRTYIQMDHPHDNHRMSNIELVMGLLLYCIYKCYMFSSSDEASNIPLEVEHCQPRSTREQLLCLAFTSHLLHPRDLKSWLRHFTNSSSSMSYSRRRVPWFRRQNEEGEDNNDEGDNEDEQQQNGDPHNTDESERNNCQSLNGREAILVRRKDEWFPAPLRTNSHGKTHDYDDDNDSSHDPDPDDVDDESFVGGNTPLHLVWNDISHLCTQSPRLFVREDYTNGTLSIIDRASEIGFLSLSSSSLSDSSDDDSDSDDSSSSSSDDDSIHSLISDNDNDDDNHEHRQEERFHTNGNTAVNYNNGSSKKVTAPKPMLTHAKVLLKELLPTREEQMTAVSFRNVAGELPLHRLLRYGTPDLVMQYNIYWDTCLLVDLFPQSCFIVDPLTNLYPFMLAAAATTTTTTIATSTSCRSTSTTTSTPSEIGNTTLNDNNETQNLLKDSSTSENNNHDDLHQNNNSTCCLSTIYYLLERFVTERSLFL